MRFSIITCAYNCLEGLKAARSQVLAQIGVEVEHIAVDGASSDGTREWLRTQETESSSSCLVWVSEPDRGLYDALNKGLRMATGDVVGVLHCDDVWEHGEVLAHVAAAFKSATTRLGVIPDAVYGDIRYVESGDLSRVRRVWRSGEYTPQKWMNGWMPPHTALFVRREAARRVGEYRLDLGSAADYEWMLRAGLVAGLRFVHLPEMLVRMRVGGASNATLKNRLRAHNMDRRAWEVNKLKPRPWTLPFKVLRKLPQWL